ncbi:hypothetical protein Tco_0415835 [Tanacetum coccineum]
MKSPSQIQSSAAVKFRGVTDWSAVGKTSEAGRRTQHQRERIYSPVSLNVALRRRAKTNRGASSDIMTAERVLDRREREYLVSSYTTPPRLLHNVHHVEDDISRLRLRWDVTVLSREMRFKGE